jgi:hypothetical protein
VSKAIQLAVWALFLAPLAHASGSCPVTLLSGTRSADSISVTFRNAGKLPIRHVEFNCNPVATQISKTRRTHCYEDNSLFFPGQNYTVSYTYPVGYPSRWWCL